MSLTSSVRFGWLVSVRRHGVSHRLPDRAAERAVQRLGVTNRQAAVGEYSSEPCGSHASKASLGSRIRAMYSAMSTPIDRYLSRGLWPPSTR
jgi:hypothetical protein